MFAVYENRGYPYFIHAFFTTREKAEQWTAGHPFRERHDLKVADIGLPPLIDPTDYPARYTLVSSMYEGCIVYDLAEDRKT